MSGVLAVFLLNITLDLQYFRYVTTEAYVIEIVIIIRKFLKKDLHF